MFARVMKSTAVITALVTAVLAALYHFFGQQWMLIAAISVGTTCYHFAMRLLVGYLVPKARLNRKRFWFRPRKWEASFYKMLNVKSWKQHLPTYDPREFSLESNTLEQIIQNTCGAEVVHEIIMLCSFIPLAFSLVFGEFPVFCITSVLAALADSMFVIAQRYNRPRLVRILEKKEAKRP